MEVVTQKKEEKNPIPKVSIQPCNTFLLCRKVEIPEMVGSIILADSDKWRKEFEVVASSPDLFTYLDHYDVGDILIYPIGQAVMYINVDGADYYFLDKRNVVSKR